MAEGGGSGEAGWLTVQPSLEPLLEPIRPIIEAIDSVLAALIAILNVVQFILNIIKAFLLGFLDPIRKIIETIIQEIRNIINDLRQAGFYLNGDWDLFKFENKFADLRGGFQAYQRRMIARLVDRRDPKRPDWSSSSAALCAFFYINAGDIDLIIRFIMKIIAFFKGEPGPQPVSLPRVTTPKVTYGTENAGLAAFGALNPKTFSAGTPDQAVIEWSLPTPTGGIPGMKMTPPRGFIIEVSTVEGGFGVQGIMPRPQGTGAFQYTNAMDPANNRVLRVYGMNSVLGFGAGLKKIGGFVEHTSGVSGEVVGAWVDDQGNTLSQSQVPKTIFYKQDANTPWIPPHLCSEDDKEYFGKAWFVSNSAISKILGGGTFKMLLKREDMPVHATVKSEAGVISLEEKENPTYYVRVRAVGKAIYKELGEPTAPMAIPKDLSTESLKLYRFDGSSVAKIQSPIGFMPYGPGEAGKAEEDQSWPAANPDGPSPADLGPISAPVEVSFPNEAAMEFIETVQCALTVALISSSSTPPADDGGLSENSCGGDGAGDLFMLNQSFEMATRVSVAGKPKKNLWSTKFYNGKDPKRWRGAVRRMSKMWASDLYRKINPSDNYIAVTVDLGREMMEWKWEDGDPQLPGITILQSVGYPSSDDVAKTAMKNKWAGIAPSFKAHPGYNALTFCSTDPEMSDGTPITWKGPGPLFTQDATREGYMTESYAPANTPIVYSTDPETMNFASNVLYEAGMLIHARNVLSLMAAVAPEGDSGWIAVRPFNKVLAPVDQLLDKIEKFLMAILDALQGLIDEIIRYIEGIQSRIGQLQALIEYIRSLLRMIDVFALPSCSALVLVENGTDGILQGLVMAEDAPSDSRSSYGGGVVVALGGLPLLILELFAAIIAAGNAEDED